MLRLTKSTQLEPSLVQIVTLLDSHAEWIHTGDERATSALRRSEVDVRVAHGNLVLSCWTETGTRSWKINAWEWTGTKLLLEASRRMGAESGLIELVPRASATAIAATVRAARQARCDQLARLISSLVWDGRLERASLSPGIRAGRPGRYARIIVRQKYQRIAVTGSVASHNASDVDSFMSSSLLWYTRAAARIRPPYLEQLWLLLEGELLKGVLSRVPFLKQNMGDTIRAFEIVDGWTRLAPLEIPTRDKIWRRRLARFPPSLDQQISNSAKRIIAESPDCFDVVQARHGETLRYLGLPVARSRRVMGSERVWFGIDTRTRTILDDGTINEWTRLLDDLAEHRNPSAADKRHALFRGASEAWLESILRREITKLDPGLIVAPLYAQFRTTSTRTSARPIDLLALRQDGRLVVIELKVTEDREHVFQALGYWQRVEAHRRRGHISGAKLFGGRPISDQSPLIYLVAPMLHVHRAFRTLARFIAPDIEIYRFDINEDWRCGVRVMRRIKAN